MAATMQSITAILKERYEDKMNKQIDDEAVALRRITRTSDGIVSDIGGKYTVFPIHTRRNQGIGARRESEVLPPAGQQGTAVGRIRLSYLYGTMELSGQAFELADSKPQAFVSALDLETNGLKSDLAKDLNRQVYGDGTGIIASFTGEGVVDSTQYIQDGMQVDVYNESGVLQSADNRIVAWDDESGEVEFATSVTTTEGGYFTRTGSKDREWPGLARIIGDDSELYDIDPNTERTWKSSIDTSADPRAISEARMVTMYNRIRKNGQAPTLILTSPGVWSSYWALLSQQRQFVNTTEFTGGFKGLAFATEGGEIPVVQDFDAPAGTMFFLNEKDIKVYRENDWRWMSRDGNMFKLKTGADGHYDAYFATMFQYSTLGVHRRNSHGKIENLIELV